jgi:hypothetical protein
MKNSPAFQFYAGDWIKSRSVRLMDAEQRGWYIQLLAEAWDGTPQCMLPKDEETLMTLAGVSDQSKFQPAFNARWTAVKRMFNDNGNYLANERQLECLAAQNHYRENARLAGQKSAIARDAKRKELQRLKKQIVTDSNNDVNGGSAAVEPLFNGNPTLLSPSSSPSPKVNTRAVFIPPTPEEVEQYSNSIGYPMCGMAWCDCYEQKGWMVGKSKMKSWKAAVRTWKNNGWHPVQKKTQSHSGGNRILSE